jgi:hypothetical protein
MLCREFARSFEDNPQLTSHVKTAELLAVEASQKTHVIVAHASAKLESNTSHTIGTWNNRVFGIYCLVEWSAKCNDSA